MVLHNLLVPVDDPVAARTFLSSSTSRMTIIMVRRMLSDAEIEVYGILRLMLVVFQRPYHPRAWEMSNMTPTAISMMLVQSAPTGPWKTRVLAHRAKIHEAGQGNDPEVPGADHVTTIELKEESALATWATVRTRIKQTTNQKTIG